MPRFPKKEIESESPRDHRRGGKAEETSGALAATDAPLGGGHSKESEEGRPIRKKRRQQMEVQEVASEPPLRRYLIFNEAHRLATMPRKKWGEFAQTAFWSTLVSVPGGVAGVTDILATTPAQSKLLDLAEIIVLAVCAAALIWALVSREEMETSVEYLNKLYNISPLFARKRRWYFLWLS